MKLTYNGDANNNKHWKILLPRVKLDPDRNHTWELISNTIRATPPSTETIPTRKKTSATSTSIKSGDEMNNENKEIGSNTEISFLNDIGEVTHLLITAYPHGVSSILKMFSSAAAIVVDV